MFDRSVDLYDLIYQGMKDYRAEARAIAEMLRREHPAPRTVLDVACGTAEHAVHLSAEHGYEVDGIDLEPGFVALARRKCPVGSFWQADMTSFDLGKKYDAVLCLFSSIGYVVTHERLVAALTSMARHIAPGGVLVVEPWFPPGFMTHGRTAASVADSPNLTVARMSHVALEGRVSRLVFEYLIGRPEGIERAREEHVLGLFGDDEMQDAFRAVGLSVAHDPRGLTGRGLYLGRFASPA